MFSKNSKLSKTSDSSKEHQASTRRPSSNRAKNSFLESEKRSKNLSSRFLEEDELQLQINIAQEQQKLYVEAGALIEAGSAKKKVSELKTKLSLLKQGKTKEKQVNEMLQLEQEHNEKLKIFNNHWDSKVSELRRQFSLIEQEILSKHQKEMKEFLNDARMSLPFKPKGSPELLNLRKIQQTLIRQKEYIEAHHVKQKCMILEREEVEKWVPVRNSKIYLQKVQLEKKQALELNNFQKRMISIQEEQKKERVDELERLIQNFNNLKKEKTIRNQNKLIKMTPRMSQTDSFFRSSQGSKFGGSSYDSRFSFMSAEKNWIP